MATITVGQQYRREFDSIVRLHQGGFLSSDVNIRRAERGRIETDAHTFVLDDGFGASDNQSAYVGFTKKGASWFANVRGEKAEDHNGEWQMLIEAVSADYHKNYSFLEFKQKKTSHQQSKEKELANKVHEKLLCRLFDKVALSAPVAVGDAALDVYGVSMKLDISSGVGQAEPILCKMYFRKESGVIAPLKRDQAQEVESFINSTVPQDSDDMDAILDDEYSKIIGEVFFALSNCIEDKQDVDDNDFTDYVLFGATDTVKLCYMLDHLANSNVKNLTCSNAQVLGISHVEWQSSTFKIKQGDKDVLALTVGFNNSVDLRCLNCQEDNYLIAANGIKVTDGEKEQTIYLDPTQDNFGLSNEDIDNIKANSAFANHLFAVDCSQFTDNDCRRIVCAAQAFDACGAVRCKNCHHPEVVYVDVFDTTARPKVTSTLAFAYDKLALVEKQDEKGKSNLFTCPCCHQTYTKDVKQYYGLCEHCAVTDDSAEGKAKYRQYRKMLSPITRLLHIRDKKSCKEYQTLVIFTLGNTKYIFNKLDADDDKLIKGPTKHTGR